MASNIKGIYVQVTQKKHTEILESIWLRKIPADLWNYGSNKVRLSTANPRVMTYQIIDESNNISLVSVHIIIILCRNNQDGCIAAEKQQQTKRNH